MTAQEQPAVLLRRLGLVDYEPTFRDMRTFTQQRTEDTPDELWLLEHPPVFTQGIAGKAEHLLAPGDIPLIQADRGGQVTYHAPGQWVVYLLVDLRRRNIGVRSLVDRIESAIIATLAEFAIVGAANPSAPGVYVDGAKVASLGLRVRRGCSYHGLALNVNLDLEPFRRINPCGYAGLEVTSIAALRGDGGPSMEDVAEVLIPALLAELQD